MSFIKNIEFSKVHHLSSLINFDQGRVNSKTLVNRDNLSLTLFAFDKGEGLSTHSAPGDAMVVALEGSVDIVIGENPQITLKAGETVVMPADIPHALSAPEPFKMLLILVKP